MESIDASGAATRERSAAPKLVCIQSIFVRTANDAPATWREKPGKR